MGVNFHYSFLESSHELPSSYNTVFSEYDRTETKMCAFKILYVPLYISGIVSMKCDGFQYLLDYEVKLNLYVETVRLFTK